jgi:hypothetical protein
MNKEEAIRIWGSTLSDEELEEWIQIVNKRDNDFDSDDEFIGETIEIKK